MIRSLLALLALTLAPPAAALEYRTDAYALIADLPDSWHTCLGEAPEPNHGFWVLMEQGDCHRHYPVAKVAFPMVTFTVNQREGLPRCRVCC